MRDDLLRYQRLKLYLICYCVYRFFTEFIRPEPIWWAGLTFYQWDAIVLAAGLAAQWMWDSRLVARERQLQTA
jgi:prolipoprotein diacylglyceryltransferase